MTNIITSISSVLQEDDMITLTLRRDKNNPGELSVAVIRNKVFCLPLKGNADKIHLDLGSDRLLQALAKGEPAAAKEVKTQRKARKTASKAVAPKEPPAQTGSPKITKPGEPVRPKDQQLSLNNDVEQQGPEWVELIDQALHAMNNALLEEDKTKARESFTQAHSLLKEHSEDPLAEPLRQRAARLREEYTNKFLNK